MCGIALKLLGIFCGFIPIVNLIILFKLIAVSRAEIKYETEFENKKLQSFEKIDGHQEKDYVTQSILDYINQFKINNGIAYIATGKNLGQEEIIKITFRDSREYVLPQDNINYSKGNGEFKLTTDSNSYAADDGTYYWAQEFGY